MEKNEVLSCALSVVQHLGSKQTGKKKIYKYDDQGVIIDMQEIDVTVERKYDDFGFQISFLEESKELCAIWFRNELVFSTIEDQYDPDRYNCRSPFLLRLVESDSPDYKVGKVFYHGAWESGLKRMSENYQKVLTTKARFQKETDAVKKRVMDLNETMLKFLPIKVVDRGLGQPILRRYLDTEIYVEGDELLKVYVYGEKTSFFKRKLVLVFDAANLFFVDGPWVQHVEKLTGKKKTSVERLAKEIGYDLYPRKEEASKKETEINLKLSEEEYLRMINDYTK